MIDRPDFDRAWEYENGFYLTCDITRMSKVLAHYELYKMAVEIPGAVVECGVFKGASLSRFAMFRELLQNPYAKKIVAFDTFGAYPPTDYEPDKKWRDEFTAAAGDQSISVTQMQEVLKRKGCDRFVELVPGDVRVSVPAYLARNPQLKISLLNLDTDVYEPAVTILEHLYPRLCRGGVLILDDYGTFPGETRAVDDYFAGRPVKIKKLPFALSPCYLVKDD